MNIFDYANDKNKTSTKKLMDKLQLAMSRKPNPLKEFGGRIFSMENMDDGEKAQANDSLLDIENTLTTVLAETTGEEESPYTEEQVDAGIRAAVAASGAGTVINRTSKRPVLEEGDRLVESYETFSGETSVPRIREALEAYDDTENKNTMMISFVYNLKAARQDEFGEAFFPTVVLSPDTATVTITVDLLSVQEEQQHSIDGTFNYMFHQKSLVNALVYPDILNNDTTRIYPVVQAGNPENLKNFVDPADVAPDYVQLENGESILTAPLKVGREFSLLGLGSADYLVKNSVLDFTDALDPSIKLKRIYLKLASGDVVVFDNLNIMSEANFVIGVQGHNREMNLNFVSRSMKIDAKTTKVDGSPLNNPVVTNNYTANLTLRLNGSFNLMTSMGSLSAGEVTVNSIYNSAKDKLDLTQGTGKTAADSFADAKIIGYDLEARRVNSNRRERGQILDLNRERMVYSLPILAPISVVRPVGEDGQVDSARLDSLVTATYVRCSNAAVATLLATEKYLAQLPEIFEPELVYNSTTLGAARYFVTPHYKHKDLDVEAQLNTLKSSDRILDVQAVLVNHIREMVFTAYLESNYKSVASVLNGENANKKPLVIIGTDPYIANYLMVHGDFRTVGEEFDVKIVSTPNMNMRGKIIMAFGKNGTSGTDVANPLHFGNMFWRPELTSILNISRNNTHNKELTVQPSFLHVVHCPVMCSIDVKNLPAAVTQMAPIKTTVTP